MGAQIPVFKPLLTDDEINAAVESLKRGWLGMGSYVGDFEQKILEFLAPKDDRAVVALNTGHSALHLAMILLGIGPGDEVITPSFNNIADFQAIKAVGAEIVFCDVLEDTLCIDPAAVRPLIGKKTKAIIVMDYATHLCDFASMKKISEDFNIPIIHDAAHSFGGEINGTKVGLQFDITMFSFDPVKNITCIDGGALVLNKAKYGDKIIELREMRLVGMGQPSEVMYQDRRAWTYDVSRLGFRYHMANLHAAIGIQQLAKIEEIRRTRQESCRYYSQQLNKIQGLEVPRSDFNGVLPFIYFLRIKNGQRDPMIKYLSENGVDSGLHWQAGHAFSFFKDCRRGPLTITEKIVKEILTIPLHSKMAIQDQDIVIKAIKKNFNVGHLT